MVYDLQSQLKKGLGLIRIALNKHGIPEGRLTKTLQKGPGLTSMVVQSSFFL